MRSVASLSTGVMLATGERAMVEWADNATCLVLSMSKNNKPTPSHDRPYGHSRQWLGGIAFTVVILMVCMRGASELAMMREVGADPQMPIWGMIVLVKVVLWFLLGGLLAGTLVTVWPRHWGSVTALVLLLAWTMAIGAASWEYQRARRALADASNPSTSSDRLDALVHFDGIQAGYELDNRIPSHPNTAPATLRELYQRGQLGTQMCLAHNPNTPASILEELSEFENVRSLPSSGPRTKPRIGDDTSDLE